MTPASAPAGPRRLHPTYVIGYLMFGMVAVRELTGAGDAGRRLSAALLLVVVLLLFVVHTPLFRRWPASRLPYFVVQTTLIQALGLLPPYQDVWALLYVLAAVQARESLSVRAGLGWLVR